MKKRSSKPVEPALVAEKILGRCSRMVCGSKSRYSDRHPEHFVVFNSNVCTLEDGKIWYGDIDVTVDADLLTRLATKLQKTVLVLYEMDARFENEDQPLYDKAAFLFHANDVPVPGFKIEEYVQVCKRGKLVGKWVLKRGYRH